MGEKLPRGVVALGLVSLFMDISSEMVHALLPLFLTATLGASVLTLGLIEGLAEAVAQITKVFSGALSDHFGRRKPLALLGYGLSALTKPVFALAAGPVAILAARVVDRIGKGIRGAPRDALLADIAPADRRGEAFGLRQTMDSIGAFAGPLLAVGLLWLVPGGFRLIFALAVIPAVLALTCLVFGVREPADKPKARAARPRLDRASLAALGPAFWAVTGVGLVLTLARMSEAFLILKASDSGLGLTFAPLVLAVMNLVYAASAWPAGRLADQIGQRGLLASGFGVLALAHGLLGMAQGPVAVLAGVALFGLHMGLTQGLLSAEVARTAPAQLRGTAFGMFNLVTGLGLLVSNVAAGALWSVFGPQAAFLAGALAALAGLAMLLWQREARS